MATTSSNPIPQWKKDLILRRRNQSKCQQLLLPPAPLQSSDAVGCTGQQPSNNSNLNSSSVDRSICGGGTCNNATCLKMVQERPWIEKQHSYDYKDNSSSDSDSSEDLHYGPGIVNKLKNRYLSLALRENNTKTRPSILPMRKATSLENLLDSEDVKSEERLFEKKQTNQNNRFRNPVRSVEIMKRSRSIETISREKNVIVPESRPKSLHEEMLIEKEGNDSWRNHHDNNTSSNKVFSNRVNKPKRIAPVMNEKEKPPADVVKQTKKLFEGRPEQRTRPPHATGEVAAKVATYKSIIVQTKVNKKPLIKAKPTQLRKPSPPVRLAPTTSPIPPDISKTTNDFDHDKQFNLKNSSLTETPDLILHSSPTIASPTYRIETTRKFLKEEINNYVDTNDGINHHGSTPVDIPPPTRIVDEIINQNSLRNESVIKSTNPLKPTLTVRELEKNLINTAKTLNKKTPVSAPTTTPTSTVVVVSETVNEIHVPKVNKKPPPHRVEEQQNSIVFKFTDRKDIPDYVGNDGRTRTEKVALPKVNCLQFSICKPYKNETLVLPQ